MCKLCVKDLAEWSGGKVNELPDSSFAWIESGGKKDESGKTEPRSLRHLPYKNAQGNPDAAHVRNALARLNQVKGMSAEKKAEVRKTLQNALEKINKNSENLHFTAAINLSENDQSSDIEVLRVGIIRDRGLKITPEMLKDYVKNFNDSVYGTDIQINFRHDREGEAAGWIKKLYIQGQSLMAKVEWTQLGAEKIRQKLYQFVSSELAPKFQHADTGKTVNNVLIGAALTNVPALKRQQPITLSEEDEQKLINSLKALNMLKDYLKNLAGRKHILKDDVEFAKKQLDAEDGMDETEKDELRKEIQEIEARVEEIEDKLIKGDEDDGEDEDEEEEMSEEEKAKKLADEEAKKETEKGDEKLNERLTLTEQKLAETQAKLDLKELGEQVDSALILSEEKSISTGFTAKDKLEVVKFMLSLNAEQRESFKGLVAKIQSVDFNEYGSSKGKPFSGISKDEQLVALAQELIDNGKAKTIEEAQKLAEKQLGIRES